MHRRTLALAAAAALLTGTAAVGLPGPAGAATPTVTKRTLTFDVVVGPQDDHHCSVVADLYTPSTATAATPAPAILTTNGFGGSKDDQAGIGQAFGERGYVVLSYSGLGFGGSGCKITLDDPDWDGKAASQLVSFLGGSKAATDGTRIDDVRRDAIDHAGVARTDDPRVGMIGGSYGGQIQLAVAGIDPRVDTIVPIITWNDLAYSLAPNNTSFTRGVSYVTPGTEKVDWTTLFFADGIADGVQYAAVDPSRLVGCPNFADQACAAKAQMDALGYPDASTIAFARHASVATYLDRVRIPTLLVQGEADTLFDLQEAVATYRGLRAQGTPVQMIWQSWGHSHGTPAPGELNLDGSDPTTTYEGARFADWFDHYLKDSTVSTGPGFAYFRDWVDYSGTAAPAYASAGAYPVGSAQKLYLSGSDALVTAMSQVHPGSATYANLLGPAPTSYSETSAAQDSIPDEATPPTDAPGTYAAWTTAPLTAAADTVGVPTLDVRLSSAVAQATQSAGPAGQLLLFAKVYDVAPDGSVTLVHRLVSPIRVADVTKPLHLELPGIVHRFAAGHRLRLVLAATDAAYRNNATVTPVTALTDPADPGVLTLPVVGSSVRTG